VDKAYLVLVQAHMVSGQILSDFDVFRAEDAETAKNYARNIFIKEAGGAVTFGGTIYLADSISALVVKDVAVIDLEHPENHAHAASADVFEQFLKDYETQESKRPSRSFSGS